MLDNSNSDTTPSAELDRVAGWGRTWQNLAGRTCRSLDTMILTRIELEDTYFKNLHFFDLKKKEVSENDILHHGNRLALISLFQILPSASRVVRRTQPAVVNRRGREGGR